MNIQDLKKVFKVMVEKDFRGTMMLWARHGIGKSSVIRQIGKEIDYRVIDIRLAQKEAIDITGMLYTFVHPELENMSVTSNHPPEWFASAVKKGKVILFLDEFNMARREVMNAVFELVLDRKLNNISLPDDVIVVCAGNPDEGDRYDVTPMSESLVDRLLHIKVTPDVDGWLDYAESKNCDPRILSFIRATPTALYHPNKLDEAFPVKIKHSERTWLDRANAILGLGLDQDLQLELLCGALGAEIATLFDKTIKKDSMPVSVKEIFAWKKDTVERLARYREQGRQDLLTMSVKDLIHHLGKNPVEAKKNMAQVLNFIQAVPAEQAVMLLHGTRLIEGYSKEFLKIPALAKQLADISEVVQEVRKAKEQNAAKS